MTHTQINIAQVIEACDRLSRKVSTVEGGFHGSSFFFNACMRAFDCKALPAEAITFSVRYNYPVNLDGEATIHRDGTLEMRTGSSQN